MSTEHYKAIVRRWVEEYWNQGKVTLLEETHATDYVLHNPDGPVYGQAGFRQFAARLWTAFADIHVTLDDVIAEGDKVGWRYTFQGTHRGELLGIPPTGRTVTITGSVISRFAEGKWIEDWHHQDTLGMLHQLGATSLPE